MTCVKYNRFFTLYYIFYERFVNYYTTCYFITLLLTDYQYVTQFIS